MSLKAAVNLFFERDRQRDTKRDTAYRTPTLAGQSAGHRQNRGEIPAPAEGVPREWISGVNRLQNLPFPPVVDSDRWQRLKADAEVFLGKWGAQAARLGWPPTDVFGMNATKPFERLDAAGLVWLLNGRPVVALTASEAVIQCSTGSRQTFRRKLAGVVTAKRCFLWELSGGEP